MMNTNFSALPPSGQNVTMGQATQETLAAAANMPEPIAKSMLYGLGISQWANQPGNGGMMDSPEFMNSYNSLFGQNNNFMGLADKQGILGFLGALLKGFGNQQS